MWSLERNGKKENIASIRVKHGLNCQLCYEILFTETLMMDHGVVSSISPLLYLMSVIL